MNLTRKLSRGVIAKIIRKIVRFTKLCDYEDLGGEFRVKLVGCERRDVRVGDGSYSNGLELIRWGDEGRLTVGKFCSFADDIRILLGGQHEISHVSTYPFRQRWKDASIDLECRVQREKDVVIGNDVWVGHHVIILGGVTIGDGAVLAAGSVVVSDIPAYAICGGVPAKKIRDRFDVAIKEALLRSGWWDLPYEVLKRAVRLLDRPEEFLRYIEKEK